MNHILLINTSFRENCLSEYSSFGPPMGLLAISSALKENGYSVEIIDPQLNSNYLATLSEALSKPLLFVGMSSYLGENVRHAATLTKLIKRKKPDLPIVLGGPLATSIPEVFFDQMLVDYIVMGSGEETIVDLANALRLPSVPTDLSNVSYRCNDKLIIGEMPVFSGELDDLPQPALEDWEEGIKKIGRIPLITSRGCDRGCSFCYNTFTGKRSYYLRSPENVISEMERWSSYFKINIFEFFDDNFLLDPQRALKILGEMERRRWRVDRLFGHLDEFDNVTPEQLAGTVNWLVMCIESASPRIQKVLNKKIDIEKALDLIVKVTNQKIKFLTAFMFGIPGESDEDIRLSIELAERIRQIDGSNTSMCYIYAPQPKDAIVRRLGPENKIDFSLDAVSKVEVVPVPPDNRLDLRLRPWMNKEDQTFYLDFVLVWQHYFAGFQTVTFDPQSIFNKNDRIASLFKDISPPKNSSNRFSVKSFKAKIYNAWNRFSKF